MLDSRGRVIGVNTAIFTNTGTSAGVGFAIPIDSVARVVPQLIKDGQVTTPTLGVAFASPAIAASLKVSDGALIQVWYSLKCTHIPIRLRVIIPVSSEKRVGLQMAVRTGDQGPPVLYMS